MRRHHANLAIIGAGSAGLVSAYLGAALKARVVLIEKGEMGGDCLNSGCVPSKSLIAAARLLHQMGRAAEYGINAPPPQIDFARVMARVHSVIAAIAPHDSVERYTQLGVEVVQGTAELVSPQCVRVGQREIRARSLILATGAEPFVPPIEGLQGVQPLTSDNLWQLGELPRRLVVLGGGPIGCELAQCFARFGSRVTVVEMLPRLLVREDEDIATEVATALAADGVDLRLGHRATRVEQGDGAHRLHCEHNGTAVTIEFDRILVAVGRAARLRGYGLEALDIPITPQRTLQVNDYLQAGHPSVYACGDVVGPYQFTHAAAHQAWYATVNALFRPFKRKVDYRVMPWTTYTTPEVARVGLNEQEAAQQGVACEVTRYDLAKLDRALTDGHAHGTVKVLTARGKDKILGATIVGHHAGDLIAEFVLAMRCGLGLKRILQTIHCYPTWMEANKFVAGEWRRRHAPAWALAALERFHRWRR